MSKYYDHEVVKVVEPQGHLGWRTVDRIDELGRKIPRLNGNESIRWTVRDSVATPMIVLL